jgi:hypothetical protein
MGNYEDKKERTPEETDISETFRKFNKTMDEGFKRLERSIQLFPLGRERTYTIDPDGSFG